MKPNLKIMHLISSISVGGAQRVLLDLAEKTNRERFEIHVCTFGTTKDRSFLDDFNKLGLPFFQISTSRFYDFKNLTSVLEYIRKHNINIIHTHLTEADIIGRLAGLLTRTPVITTIHNEPRRFKDLRVDQRVLNYLSAKYLATHLVAVSGFLREHFIAEWKVAKENISTIYNGVDVSLYLEAPIKRRREANVPNLTITNVGRLSKQKGQHILLEAARKVVNQFPNTQFLFVGQGELEQDLRILTQNLGLEENVVFMGVRRDVADILARSDIFVLSSLWEGLPISAIEAMASACATILTNVGGNCELIEHGKNGMIVPTGDSNALAEAMITLVGQNDLRLSLGRAARTQVVEKFGLALMVRQYEELYKKVWAETR